MIFAYTAKDEMLYYRQQRDRYTVRYTVGPCGKRRLRRLGMNAKYRLQFEL